MGTNNKKQISKLYQTINGQQVELKLPKTLDDGSVARMLRDGGLWVDEHNYGDKDVVDLVSYKGELFVTKRDISAINMPAYEVANGIGVGVPVVSFSSLSSAYQFKFNFKLVQKGATGVFTISFTYQTSSTRTANNVLSIDLNAGECYLSDNVKHPLTGFTASAKFIELTVNAASVLLRIKEIGADTIVDEVTMPVGGGDPASFKVTAVSFTSTYAHISLGEFRYKTDELSFFPAPTATENSYWRLFLSEKLSTIGATIKTKKDGPYNEGLRIANNDHGVAGIFIGTDTSESGSIAGQFQILRQRSLSDRLLIGASGKESLNTTVSIDSAGTLYSKNNEVITSAGGTIKDSTLHFTPSHGGGYGKPYIVLNKPGVNYAAIGSTVEANQILFSKSDYDGNWVPSDIIWNFEGELQENGNRVYSPNNKPTKTDVGLNNVDNTSDADKPVSTAQALALSLKTDKTELEAHKADNGNPHGVTKDQVGLGNADNTSDAAKPLSIAASTEFGKKAPKDSPIFTGPVILPPTTTIGEVSNTEISYLNGVTSPIQAQIDSKQPTGDYATNTVLNTEITNRTDADNALQLQINALNGVSEWIGSVPKCTVGQEQTTLTNLVQNKAGRAPKTGDQVSIIDRGDIWIYTKAKAWEIWIDVVIDNATKDTKGLVQVGEGVKVDAGVISVTSDSIGLGNVLNVDTTDASKIVKGILSVARLSDATPTVKGAMSAADKTKLDGVQAGAQVNTVTNVAGKIGAVNLVKGDVGLGSVDNTSDANKPVSTATKTVLDTKAEKNVVDTHIRDVANPHRLTASQVGLGDVDNTSDVNKPVSTAQRTALDTAIRDVVSQDINSTSTVTAPSSNAVKNALEGLTQAVFPINQQSEMLRFESGSQGFVDELKISSEPTQIVSPNLIPFPYSDGSKKTAFGITFTAYDKGTILVSGTATGFATFVLARNIVLNAGTYNSAIIEGLSVVLYNVSPQAGEPTYLGYVFTLTRPTALQIYLQVSTGETVNNVKCFPMLNAGATALPAQPYTGQLSPENPMPVNVVASPLKVNSIGANLFNINTVFTNFQKVQIEQNSLLVECLDMYGSVWVDYANLPKNKDVTVSFNYEGISKNNASMLDIRLYKNSLYTSLGVKRLDFNTNFLQATFNIREDYDFIRIIFYTNYGYKNTPFNIVKYSNIMVNMGSTAVPYAPYVSQTTSLPLLTTNNNIVDLLGEFNSNTNVLAQKWAKTTYDGGADEAIDVSIGTEINVIRLTANKVRKVTTKVYCDKGPRMVRTVGTPETYWMFQENLYCIDAYPSNANDLWYGVPKTVDNEYKARQWLAANPITVYYELATPEILTIKETPRIPRFNGETNIFAVDNASPVMFNATELLVNDKRIDVVLEDKNKLALMPYTVSHQVETNENGDTLDIALENLEASISDVNTDINTHIANKSNPHNVTKAQLVLERVDNTNDLEKPISTKTQTALDLKATKAEHDLHTGNKNNPHNVTKAQVGLTSVDDTSDAKKPISEKTQAALNLKATAADLTTHIANKLNPHGVTKAQLELGNVTNTADADKPVSTAQQTALNLRATKIEHAAHLADDNNPHKVTKAQVGLTSVDDTSDMNKPVSTDQQAALDLKATKTDLTTHISNKLNPHGVTKAQVGLGNADNTSDANKPVSTKQQTALDLKADKSVVDTNKNSLDAHLADAKNPHKVTKSDVGLGNVDNTSDANKPISIPVREGLTKIGDDLAAHTGNRNNPHQVTKAQVGLGNVDNTSDANKPVSIPTQHALTGLEGALIDHLNNVSNPHQVTKTQVGLGNVDNTSDANKPVSTAAQTALNLKADKSYTDTELGKKVDKSVVGVANGVASLDATGLVPEAQQHIRTVAAVPVGSGETVRVPSTRAGIVDEFEISSEPVQIGAPTPANPIPINAVASPLKATSVSANLFSTANFKTIIIPDYSTTYTTIINSNSFSTTKNMAGQNQSRGFKVNVIPNTKYCLSADVTYELLIAGTKLQSSEFFIYDITNGHCYDFTNYIIRLGLAKSNGINNLTFTIPQNVTKIGIVLNMQYLMVNENWHECVKCTLANIMLNIGTTALPYTPYISQTTPLPLLTTNNTPVELLGTLKSRTNILQQRWKKIILDGSENWGLSTTVNKKYSQVLIVDDMHIGAIPSIANPIFSNMYIKGSPDTVYLEKHGTIAEGKRLEKGSICIYDNSFTSNTTTAWKAHLQELMRLGTPLTVYYQLATPEIITLQPLPDIPTLDGETNIFAVDNASPVTFSIGQIPAPAKKANATLSDEHGNALYPRTFAHQVEVDQASGKTLDAKIKDIEASVEAETLNRETVDATKAPLASPTFTGTVVLPSTTSIGTVTNIEIGYLDGVTSSIQAQINSKQSTGDYATNSSVTVVNNKLSTEIADRTTAVAAEATSRNNADAAIQLQVDALKAVGEWVGSLATCAAGQEQSVLTAFVKTETAAKRGPKVGDQVSILDRGDIWIYTKDNIWKVWIDVVIDNATTSTKGLVQVGDGVNVADGVISVTPASIGLGNVKNTDTTDASNIVKGILPVTRLSDATPTVKGAMSAADKAKLDSVQAGAQVNTVTSVAGKTGAVILVKGDVGLGNVEDTDTTDASNIVKGILPVARLSDATPTVKGAMSAADKAKLDSVQTGAQVNTVTSVAGKTGTVALVKGDVGLGNVENTDTTDASNIVKGILPVARLSDATPTVKGAMSAADKAKLDGVQTGAQVNTVTSVAGKTGTVALVKGDVGLGNVDNTSDANKPVSTATKTALDTKADVTDLAAHIGKITGNPHNVTKGDLSLGNVDNTSDASKPISAKTQTALDLKADKSELGQKADSSTLTEHINNKSNPHAVNKAQVGLGNVDNTSDANKPISIPVQGGLTKIGDDLAAHTGNRNNPHQVTKAQVGLGNADNTSDANKPVSIAQQAALNLKADKSYTDTQLGKKVDKTMMGAANGVASLTDAGLVPEAQQHIRTVEAVAVTGETVHLPSTSAGVADNVEISSEPTQIVSPNLIRLPNAERTLNGITASITDGLIKMRGIKASPGSHFFGNIVELEPIKLEANVKYTVAINLNYGSNAGGNWVVELLDSNKTRILALDKDISTKTFTFTLTTAARFVNITLYIAEAAPVGTEIETYSYLTINKGTTALPYQPYTGSPSPNNVIPVTATSGPLKVVSQGLNLFNVNGEIGNIGNMLEVRNNEVWSRANNYYFHLPGIRIDNLKPRTKYKISGKVRVSETPANMTGIYGAVILSNDLYTAPENQITGIYSTFTTSWKDFDLSFIPRATSYKTPRYLNFGYAINETRLPDTFYMVFKDIMLTEGTTVLPYAPYVSQTTPLPLLTTNNTPVDLLGTLDSKTNALEQRWKKLVLDGSENWGLAQTVTKKYSLVLVVADMHIGDIPSIANPIFSNMYTKGSCDDIYTEYDGVIAEGKRTEKGSIHIYDSAYTSNTPTAWKAHLQELARLKTPLIVYYQLATPEVIPLQPLPNIPTLNGETNIYAVDNASPVAFTVTETPVGTNRKVVVLKDETGASLMPASVADQVEYAGESVATKLESIDVELAAEKLAREAADSMRAPIASPVFTGSAKLPAATTIGTVTGTEIGYLSGVTSGIQTQLGSKLPLAGGTVTGLLTVNEGIKFIQNGVESTISSTNNYCLHFSTTAPGGSYFYQPAEFHKGLLLTNTDGTRSNVVDALGQIYDKGIRVYSPNNKPTSADVGLGKVENIADIDKKISKLTQDALNLKAFITDVDLKAPIASPTFTGTVGLPSTTTIGTVTGTEIGYLSGVTSGIQTQLGSKLPLTGGTVTGLLTVNEGIKFIQNGVTASISSKNTAYLHIESTKPFYFQGDTFVHGKVLAYESPATDKTAISIDGQIFDQGVRVYSPNNKPTPGDIGASVEHQHPYVAKVAATVNAVTKFSSADGEVKNSGVTIDDSNNIFVPGTINAQKNIVLAPNHWISDGVGGINANNSDIIKVNGIWMADPSDNPDEGINFYRSGTTWDSLYANNGTLYFAPDKPTVGQGSPQKVWHAGNDGAGSGLNADMIDGIDSSGLYRLTGIKRTVSGTLNQEPQHLTVNNQNSALATLAGFAALSGQQDFLYIANKKPGWTITASGYTGNINDLFDGNLATGIALTAGTPFVLEVKRSNNIEYSDVMELQLYSHCLGYYLNFNDYKVEALTATDTWVETVKRVGVSDNINGLELPLFSLETKGSEPYNYRPVKGFRLTVNRFTNNTSYAYGFSCIKLNEHRPKGLPSSAIGALDIGGGELYGNVTSYATVTANKLTSATDIVAGDIVSAKNIVVQGLSVNEKYDLTLKSLYAGTGVDNPLNSIETSWYDAKYRTVTYRNGGKGILKYAIESSTDKGVNYTELMAVSGDGIKELGQRVFSPNNLPNTLASTVVTADQLDSTTTKLPNGIYRCDGYSRNGLPQFINVLLYGDYNGNLGRTMIATDFVYDGVNNTSVRHTWVRTSNPAGWLSWHMLLDDTATKNNVGLGDVDNTSDANKPISTETQAALDLKADKGTLNEHKNSLDLHLRDKSNPHQVTKTQVGLSAVENLPSYRFNSFLIPVNTDLNTLIQEGHYYSFENIRTATFTNSPTTDTFHLLVEHTVVTLENSNVIQTVTEYHSGRKIYQRSCYNNVWSPWTRIYTTLDKPTPADIGAAPSMHTHPLPEHQHPYVAKVAATVNSVTRFSTADGEVKNSNLLLNDLGGLVFPDGTGASITGTMGGNDFYRIYGGGTGDKGYLEIATCDNGDEPITMAQYSGNTLFDTKLHEITLMDASGNTKVNSLTVAGNLTVAGTTTTINSTVVEIEDQLIKLARNNTAELIGFTGVYVPKYDGTNNGALVFDKTGTAYVGDATVTAEGAIMTQGDMKPIVVRNGDLPNNTLPKWNATTLALEDSGTLVGNVYRAYDTVVSASTNWNYIIGPGTYKVNVGATWGDIALGGPNTKTPTLYGWGILEVIFASLSDTAEKRIRQVYYPHESGQPHYRWHNGSNILTGWSVWKNYNSDITAEGIGAALTAHTHNYVAKVTANVNAVTKFSSVDGEVQNSGVLIDSSNNVTIPGTLNVHTIANLGFGEAKGIHFDPHGESVNDPSDAASICVIQEGVSGGTVLQIKQMNDPNDIVNIVTSSINGLRVNNATVWHAGNDGSGSTLDADFLDGLDSTAFSRVADNYKHGTLELAQTGVDLNTILVVGWYYAQGGNTITNKPNGVDAFGLEVLRTAYGFYCQKLTSANTLVGYIFTRTCDNGNWTAWTKINDGGNAATLDGLDSTAFARTTHTHEYAPISHQHNYVAKVASTVNAVTRFRTVDGEVKNSGVTIDDNNNVNIPGMLTVPSGPVTIGLTVHNVARVFYSGSPKEIIVKTGIKWLSGTHMPVIHLYGYAYGKTSPIEMKIGFYIFDNNIGYCGVTNMGAWNPTVRLFKYTKNNIPYVALGLIDTTGIYYPMFEVDVQAGHGLGNIEAAGWVTEYFTTTGNIPIADNGVTCCNVPYRTVYNPGYLPIEGGALTGALNLRARTDGHALKVFANDNATEQFYAQLAVDGKNGITIRKRTDKVVEIRGTANQTHIDWSGTATFNKPIDFNSPNTESGVHLSIGGVYTGNPANVSPINEIKTSWYDARYRTAVYRGSSKDILKYAIESSVDQGSTYAELMRVDAVGIYDHGHRVYSEGYKPTPTTIGAADEIHTHAYIPEFASTVTAVPRCVNVKGHLGDTNVTINDQGRLTVPGEINTRTIHNALPVQILTDGTAAQCIHTGGLLTSNIYADGNKIPTNGIYSKGAITTNGQVSIYNPSISSSNRTSQLIVGSGETGDLGDVAIELWRGNNASWKILNTQGTLSFRNNWTNTCQATYLKTAFELDFNTGNARLYGAVSMFGTLAVSSTATMNGVLVANRGLRISASGPFIQSPAILNIYGDTNATAQKINTGGVLASNAYADDAYVPTNGIYSKGDVKTSGKVSFATAGVAKANIVYNTADECMEFVFN